MLSPEEELKTFQLPEGYRMELVMSEPEIQEPVECVFDGNGRMYVAEMRSYMHDIDGTNEMAPISRVSRHENTKGDGHFDKHIIFAGNLLLPRMVLPLDKGRVIIGLTNTTDLNIYNDTNGDGISDSVVPFFKGTVLDANMEHQPSGLMWALDNWLYTTYNAYRLRMAPDGTALREPTPSNGGQWGLTQDNIGKLWWSNAGAEKGIYNFQVPILYGAINVPEQMEKGFMEVWPAIGMGDFQGGLLRVRQPDKTLNHFTGCGGQEVVRVDRLPEDLRGDVLLPEPVGRLIRRAKVAVKDGITTISNPYEAHHTEFIRSTDPYFRPIWAANGPDGCIYIVDMYRGIIQEGNWVREGSYLRKVVQQYGFDKNVGRGRIWRLVHKDYAPGPQPHMLDETPAQLVKHLDHPNGWWRDQAQKLIVLHRDKSVAPELAQMARTSPNYLTRIHALWTLEGLDALDAGLVREKFKDQNPEVRATAIRVSESLIKSGDQTLKPDIMALAKDPDPGVVLQTIGTSKVLKWPDWQRTAPATIAFSTSKGVKEIGNLLLYTPKSFDTHVYAGNEIKLLQKGQVIFQQLCFACHGVDGMGAPIDGQPSGTTLAPPLAGSSTVQGPYQGMVSVLLNGVAGPMHGKTYDAQMPPMGGNTDEWIASIASLVRNSFGNSSGVVTPAQVDQVRQTIKGRTQPWTLSELMNIVPQPLSNQSEWKVTASLHPEKAPLAVDANSHTRYSSGVPQTPGQWLRIEIPQPTLLAGLTLDASNSTDYPRGYRVELSTDGKSWKKVAEGKGAGRITQIPFTPARAKLIRIIQTGSIKDKPWSIAEVQVLEPSKLVSSTTAPDYSSQ